MQKTRFTHPTLVGGISLTVARSQRTTSEKFSQLADAVDAGKEEWEEEELKIHNVDPLPSSSNSG